MKPPTLPPTHFICLPLRSPGFRERVTAFTALLPSTINPTIIRPIGSLHFTLGVLSLKTPAEIDAAVNFLHSCHGDVFSAVQGQKLTVMLRGIASMQQNIKNTNVIYAVPEDGDGRLRLLSSNFRTHGAWLTCADLLQSKFKEARFLEGDRHSDHELHCTLLNTMHMRPRPKKRYKTGIDATDLFETEQIKEFDFGQVEIEEVQICEMGVKEVHGEIRYNSVGGISLTSLEEKTRDVVAGPARSVEDVEQMKDLEASVELEPEKT